MKSNGRQKGSITEPLLKQVVQTHKATLKIAMEAVKRDPTINNTPLQQAQLDQDAGGGYNANFTFPQD